MSQIQLSVQWNNSTVFAGEDIDCTITFKNVARPPPQSHHGPRLRHHSKRERWKGALPDRITLGKQDVRHLELPPPGRSKNSSAGVHSTSATLGAHDNGYFETIASAPGGDMHKTTKIGGSHKHRRSVSIVSIGGDFIGEPATPGQKSKPGSNVRRHARAVSLQVLPKRTGSAGNLSSPGSKRLSTCLLTG